MQILQHVSLAIGVIGIVVICWGVLLALIDFVHIRTALSYFLNMEMKHPHYRTDDEQK